jgi:hypothetical protein
MQKNFFCILKVNEENNRIQSWIRIRIHYITQRYGSPDPNPHQNVTDSQQWLQG